MSNSKLAFNNDGCVYGHWLYRRGKRRAERDKAADQKNYPVVEVLEAEVAKLRQQIRQLQSELQSERQARVWQLQVLHQQLADAQVKAGEAVALQEEIALLKQEVSKGRLPLNSKGKIEFGTPRSGYWDIHKSSRSRRKAKVKEFLKLAFQGLPGDVVVKEVSYSFIYNILETF